jgi:hypothetical protein
LHQPLHCITRVSKNQPAGDDNALKVMLTPPGADSLHWFWDCAAGNDGPDKVAEFSRSLPQPDDKEARNLHEMDWIKDGYQLAIEKAYVLPITAGDGPFTLNDDYKRTAAEVARQRIALAGRRLANILNDELK